MTVTAFREDGARRCTQLSEPGRAKAALTLEAVLAHLCSQQGNDQGQDKASGEEGNSITNSGLLEMQNH